MGNLEFEKPVLEVSIPQIPNNNSQFAGITNAISVQEDINFKGRFYVATASTLFYISRNSTDNVWTIDVIVGTYRASCIDGE